MLTIVLLASTSASRQVGRGSADNIVVTVMLYGLHSAAGEGLHRGCGHTKVAKTQFAAPANSSTVASA